MSAELEVRIWEVSFTLCVPDPIDRLMASAVSAPWIQSQCQLILKWITLVHPVFAFCFKFTYFVRWFFIPLCYGTLSTVWDCWSGICRSEVELIGKSGKRRVTPPLLRCMIQFVSDIIDRSRTKVNAILQEAGTSFPDGKVKISILTKTFEWMSTDGDSQPRIEIEVQSLNHLRCPVFNS
jgi:hypothetical protein